MATTAAQALLIRFQASDFGKDVGADKNTDHANALVLKTTLRQRDPGSLEEDLGEAVSIRAMLGAFLTAAIATPAGTLAAMATAAANKFGVDPLLVRAIMQQESHGNPHCTGYSGDIGLMQVLLENLKARGLVQQSIQGYDATTLGNRYKAAGSTQDAYKAITSEIYNKFKDEQAYDPVLNLEAGAAHLAANLKNYANRGAEAQIILAVAAYNAGDGGVEKWLKGGKLPPVTIKYVPSVLGFYHQLGGPLIGGSDPLGTIK